MSLRWQVLKRTVKYQGEVYEAGQLMPASFTARDRERQVYSRNLVPIEMPEGFTPIDPPELNVDPTVVNTEEVSVDSTNPTDSVPNKVEIGEVPKATLLQPTGTQPNKVINK